MGFVLVILAIQYVFRRKQGMACWFEMGTTLFMSLLLVYSLYWSYRSYILLKFEQKVLGCLKGL